jgi:hypothetical protein
MSPFLIPIAPFLIVLGIVGFKQMSRSFQAYLDWRLRMAEHQSGAGDRSFAQAIQAIQEMRAEIAALKHHEAEAVLSFDSTLQTLEARVKHLERHALAASPGARPPVGVSAPAEEASRLTVRAG